MADEYTLNADIYAEILTAWNLNSPPSRITNADVRMLRAANIVWKNETNESSKPSR
jgi:hypothetical protein